MKFYSRWYGTICFLSMVSAVVQAANIAPAIQNLKAQQRPGTYLVDVTFDLVDPDSYNGVFLSLEASGNNGTTYNLPVTSVSGDAGLIKPGTGKKMVWDAFKDWPNKHTPNAKVRVVANDSLPQGPGQGPVGFVWVPPGSFLMGSPEDEAGRGNPSAEIQHTVYLSPGFWISDHEVTQTEFQSVMDKNPSVFTGDLQRPVENVDWKDAVLYCQKLTESERIAGKITMQQAYRLPTEAEWEYAARAGSISARYGVLDAIAWHSGNSGSQTHPVKQKLPNPWGLYDVLGNVCEWCSDWYGEYSTVSVGNPTGPADGSVRVLRGGGWQSEPWTLRSAFREWNFPGRRPDHMGFRPVLSAIR